MVINLSRTKSHVIWILLCTCMVIDKNNVWPACLNITKSHVIWNMGNKLFLLREKTSYDDDNSRMKSWPLRYKSAFTAALHACSFYALLCGNKLSLLCFQWMTMLRCCATNSTFSVWTVPIPKSEVSAPILCLCCLRAQINLKLLLAEL